MAGELLKKEPSTASLEAIEKINAVKDRLALVQHLLKDVMKEGGKREVVVNGKKVTTNIEGDYGTIPGCGDKVALKKAGAEKCCFLFRLAPEYTTERIDMPNSHREYITTTILRNMDTGVVWAQGVGSCSTMERKYRYRTGQVNDTGKLVPSDYWTLRKDDPGKALAIIGGKGFATKKIDNQWHIVQAGEPVENDCIADVYNTCLKMSKKRSFVDASITAACASSIFDQDIDEDLEPQGKPVDAEFTDVSQGPPPDFYDQSQENGNHASAAKAEPTKTALPGTVDERKALLFKELKDTPPDILTGFYRTRKWISPTEDYTSLPDNRVTYILQNLSLEKGIMKQWADKEAAK